MAKSKLFFLFSLSFIGGIAVASFYYPKIVNPSAQLMLVVLALILLTVFYKDKTVAVTGFVILFFVLGIYISSSTFVKLNHLTENGKEFSGIAIIAKEPKIKNETQTLVIKPLKNNGEVFLVNTGIYQKYNYGEELKVNCRLQIPQNLNPDFDYRMYLAKEGIFYKCQNPQIKKINLNKGNVFYSALIKIKNKFNNNIANLIPAPESGLLSGLILGGSDKLSKSIQNNFSQTGLTHIVAVSGYNVTIIAEYLMILGIFLGLWRRQAFWFATLGIVLFVIITGASSSAVRAGIMGILLIWAIKNGRLANSQNAILFAADVMLLIKPLLFRWDTGFQLSFLASVGIIYLYPFFQNYLVKKHKIFGLSEILFLTISAQIFVLPLIALDFQKLSLISPLANLLVLPIIPLTMLVGFLAAAFSFISYYLALIFAWLAFLPLKYEMLTINFLAGFKYSALNVKINWWEVLLWYVFLAGLILMLKRKNLKQYD